MLHSNRRITLLALSAGLLFCLVLGCPPADPPPANEAPTAEDDEATVMAGVLVAASDTALGTDDGNTTVASGATLSKTATSK